MMDAEARARRIALEEGGYGWSNCNADGVYQIRRDLLQYYILSALRDAEAQAWQPIETAPKDGTWFLAASSQYRVACPARWHAHSFQWLTTMLELKHCGHWSGHPPTHWMPLPAPPEPPEKGGA
jgi:hypothetical protein